MNNDTPRTDERSVLTDSKIRENLCEQWPEVVSSDFARTLERELAKATKTRLKLAQDAFKEWLVMLDGLLETAQLKYDEALGALRNGDKEAFGTALGDSIGHIDKSRAEIKAGLESGF